MRMILPLLLIISSTITASTNSDIQIYAHMGGRDLAPQNSDAAYYLSLRKQYDFIDMDVNMTADHRVIVRHDPFLLPSITRWRHTGKWLLSKAHQLHDLSLAYVQRHFDVGRIRPLSKYAIEHKNQIPVDDLHIMTLQQQIQHIKTMQRDLKQQGLLPLTKSIDYQIELKYDPYFDKANDFCPIAKKVADIIAKEKIQGCSEIQSFEPRCLAVIRDYWHRHYDPTNKQPLHTAYLSNTVHFYHQAKQDIDGIVAERGAIWEPMYIKNIIPNKQEIAYAHQKHLKVVIWTVNKVTDMQRLIAMGVDGIITDRPDRLQNLQLLMRYKRKYLAKV